MLINHLLLIFKFYIYSVRNTKQWNFNNLKITIKKIKELEKELAQYTNKSSITYFQILYLQGQKH